MPNQNDPMAEIRASFFIECDELLEALQDGLQTMSEGDAGSETINVVFRAVHSIKGGAGAFGLESLVRFAHRFETALDEIRSGKMTPDADFIRLSFQAADHLSDLVRTSRDGEEPPVQESARLLAQLDELLGEAPEEEEISQADFMPLGLEFSLDLPEFTPAETLFDILFKPEAELFETGNEPQTLLRNLAALGDAVVTCDSSSLPPLELLSPEVPHLAWNIKLRSTVDESEIRDVFEFVEGLCTLTISAEVLESEADPDLPDLAEIVPFTPPFEDLPEPQSAMPAPAPQKPVAAPGGAAKQPAANASAQSVVRVDLERIERLVNLVGELVINQAMLSQSLSKAGLSPHSDAMNGMEEFQRLTRDIQDSVMMIRAQPVKSLFQRMSRMARESSATVGKDVRLVTDGENTEVDKTVIERLADPLTHMIRNAVDHGLESTADRIAAGKPAQGVVRLTAAHRSGRVVIEVSDDGAGINRPRVFQIAVEKGLIPADTNLADMEIDNLLFLPGFSTAGVVSDLSGRGVGMDVVKTAIQALSGRISITSERGVGTTFSISLPLTLAVLDGMVVNVSDETFVIPLNVVVETLSLRHGDVEMVRPGAFVVRVRDGFVPLYDLGVELGHRRMLDNFDGTIVLLIAREDGTRAALIIDGIQDQRQVVIKGLDDSFNRFPGIAAATILGDGQIALILDPSDIISNARNAAANADSTEKRKIGNDRS